MVLRHAFQVTLGIDGRHTPRASRCDGLSILVVLYVSRCEDPRHTRSRTLVRDDIPVGVELDLTREQRSVRSMTDREEQAIERHLTQLASLEVPHDDGGDFALADVFDVGDL